MDIEMQLSRLDDLIAVLRVRQRVTLLALRSFHLLAIHQHTLGHSTKSPPVHFTQSLPPQYSQGGIIRIRLASLMAVMVEWICE